MRLDFCGEPVIEPIGRDRGHELLQRRRHRIAERWLQARTGHACPFDRVRSGRQVWLDEPVFPGRGKQFIGARGIAPDRR